MNAEQKRMVLAHVEQIESLLADIRRAARGCETCDHWSGACDLVNAVPPAEVIAEGCERWVPEVPF